MNEFAAKKLGEVLAFCRVGQETLEKAQAGFDTHLPEQAAKLPQTIAGFADHAAKIEALVADTDVAEITMKKAEATGTKLRSMRDLYIGDEWDNPTEVLEWSGFFEGAAIVHWALVVGAAKAIGHSELESLATAARQDHETILQDVALLLGQIGEKKASA